MKIFITGATGFIGSHLVERLAETDHELCCLVRRSSAVQQLSARDLRLVAGDITDRGSLLAGMKGCDWVVNLANVYSFWEPDRRVYEEVNIRGTRNVMECALETGVAKVVHVSSLVVYGKPEIAPFTEETPRGPVHFSAYARSKHEGDQLAWELCDKKNLPLVVLYPGGVLGPGDEKASGRYIMDLLQRRMPTTVLHDAVNTWVDVRDVSETIVRALEKENDIGERYLVGKHRLSFEQFNEMVGEISAVPLPRIRLPDGLTVVTAALLTGLARALKRPPVWGMASDAVRTMKQGIIADGSKVERELGITYRPIRDTLEEAIAWYMEAQSR
jgi:dihydroflavonol-4-reductase